MTATTRYFDDYVRSEAQVRKKLKRGQDEAKILAWLEGRHPTYGRTLLTNMIERLKVESHLKRTLLNGGQKQGLERRKKDSDSLIRGEAA